MQLLALGSGRGAPGIINGAHHGMAGAQVPHSRGSLVEILRSSGPMSPGDHGLPVLRPVSTLSCKGAVDRRAPPASSLREAPSVGSGTFEARLLSVDPPHKSHCILMVRSTINKLSKQTELCNKHKY